MIRRFFEAHWELVLCTLLILSGIALEAINGVDGHLISVLCRAAVLQIIVIYIFGNKKRD